MAEKEVPYPIMSQDGFTFAVIHNLNYILHVHEELECVYILEGTLDASLEDRWYALHAGDFFVALPDQLHRYETRQSSKAFMFVIHPRAFPMRETYLEGCALNPPVYRADTYPQAAAEAVRQLAFAEHSRPKAAPLADLGRLIAVMGLLYTAQAPVRAPALAEPSIVRQVLEYLLNHKREPITLQLAAEALGLSPYQLSRVCSQQIGLGFNAYLKSVRVAAAKRHLTWNHLSISEVAQRTGFESVRTFNRAFAEEAGMTPSAYRKRHRAFNNLDFSGNPAAEGKGKGIKK